MALRVILDDCRPALFALGTAMVMLAVVIRGSGCRLNLRRLGELHRCQKGGVQSLSFVLTLPIFVMIVMFIVQVSQLMIAQVDQQRSLRSGTQPRRLGAPACHRNRTGRENRPLRP